MPAVDSVHQTECDEPSRDVEIYADCTIEDAGTLERHMSRSFGRVSAFVKGRRALVEASVDSIQMMSDPHGRAYHVKAVDLTVQDPRAVNRSRTDVQSADPETQEFIDALEWEDWPIEPIAVERVDRSA